MALRRLITELRRRFCARFRPTKRPEQRKPRAEERNLDRYHMEVESTICFVDHVGHCEAMFHVSSMFHVKLNDTV